MNTKTITILAIIALLLTAFITNPSQQKHSDVVLNQIVKQVEGDDGIGESIASGAVLGIAKMLLSQEVEVKNFYLFSISYIHSDSRNKTINAGLGLFGQVFPIARKEDWEEFEKKD
ncbi:hypothetical protein MACH07_21920 [Flagellimonas marinaquae]|uniref:DUF4359 domain-containing protein n=1 Tax=Flagellimonas marinaquae TaxID=254955 RepID=A0AA48HKH8_9FLAO|nr:hypothetical protein MACH07_21920 [Allomuricauda aquimarina]